MARAYSVWLVVHNTWDGIEPVAAFTVKHEMVTWLRSKDAVTLESLSAIRMPDGTEDAGKHFNIEEMLA